tara:strand:+ start:128 stop:1282 length:1155 start_codon:yes stop_codon:yes gene_type:complete
MASSSDEDEALASSCARLLADSPTDAGGDKVEQLRQLLDQTSLTELLRANGGTAFTAAEVAALLRVELACRGHASDLSQLAGCPRSWIWVSWPRPRGCCVVSRGHTMRVERLRPEPRMALVHEFLTPAECAHIIELARDRLHPSRVVNYDPAAAVGEVTSGRTSHSCKVSAKEDIVVMRAVQRAAYLVGLAPQNSEAVQVVHYEVGQQYKPHYDWFSREAKSADRVDQRGNRLLSIFVYLALPEAGGRTGFPQLGQSFQPGAGGALAWYNLDRHGITDERTLHAGEPVTQGEKWGMNIWLREGAAPRRPRVALALRVGDGGVAVRAELSLSTSTPAKQPDAAVVAPRCSRCGDVATPLGLCLCKAQYEGALSEAAVLAAGISMK